jgi:hypothetical protein
MQEQSRTYSHTAGIKNDHDYRVRIPFFLPGERDLNKWHEHSATAIEMFGLPGDRYSCRLTKEAIEFWFLEEKDALLFELCCG